MTKKATLTDIARVVGVSRAAVGKVLGTSNSNIRVSEEKCELIRKVAREMNYVPNVVARVLAGQSAKMIGILVDTGAPAVVNRRVRKIERYAGTLGYRVLVGEAHDNIEQFAKSLQHLRQYGVDGVICLSHDYNIPNQTFEQYFEPSKDIVMVGGPVRNGFSHVIPDMTNAADQIYNCIKARGCRRVAMITRKTEEAYYSISMRSAELKNKFGDALIALELPSDSTSDRGEGSSWIVKEKVLPQNFDAVICRTDIMALGVESALLAAGKRVPEDVAVIGFDNDDFTPYAAVPLTTIDQNNDDVAKEAVDMLLKQLSCKDFEPEVKYVNPKLIKRESC